MDEKKSNCRMLLNKQYKRILKRDISGKSLVANFNEKGVTRRLESFEQEKEKN